MLKVSGLAVAAPPPTQRTLSSVRTPYSSAGDAFASAGVECKFGVGVAPLVDVIDDALLGSGPIHVRAISAMDCRSTLRNVCIGRHVIARRAWGHSDRGVSCFCAMVIGEDCTTIGSNIIGIRRVGRIARVGKRC